MVPFANSTWWRSRTGAIFLGAAVAAALYLAFVHIDHVLKVLPLLFILACPFMHIFMHRGHGGHGHGNRDGASDGKARSDGAGRGETPDKRA